MGLFKIFYQSNKESRASPQKTTARTLSNDDLGKHCSSLLAVPLETQKEIDEVMMNLLSRRELIAKADLMHVGEIFRFLAAIVEWEQINDKKTKTMVAYKIISSFVENGSRYENNMSASTRNKLLEHKSAGKKVDKFFFEIVKMEIISDVLRNPSLKALLKRTSSVME